MTRAIRRILGEMWRRLRYGRGVTARLDRYVQR